MARGDAGKMRDLLQRRLAEALVPDGRGPATPVRESRHAVAKLVRPLEDDVAATASIDLSAAIPDRLPVGITGVHVGVSYKPLRRLWPTALAKAWLSWEEGPRERLVVSLGDQRVGTVTPAAEVAYRRVMEDAAERDELPYVPARLTPRTADHLLEIQMPDRRS